MIDAISFLYLAAGVSPVWIGFYLLYCNEWVAARRIEAAHNGTYLKLPSHGYMLFKFWVWDINKFMRESNEPK